MHSRTPISFLPVLADDTRCSRWTLIYTLLLVYNHPCPVAVLIAIVQKHAVPMRKDAAGAARCMPFGCPFRFPSASSLPASPCSRRLPLPLPLRSSNSSGPRGFLADYAVTVRTSRAMFQGSVNSSESSQAFAAFVGESSQCKNMLAGAQVVFV